MGIRRAILGEWWERAGERGTGYNILVHRFITIWKDMSAECYRRKAPSSFMNTHDSKQEIQ